MYDNQPFHIRSQAVGTKDYIQLFPSIETKAVIQSSRTIHLDVDIGIDLSST